MTTQCESLMCSDAETPRPRHVTPKWIFKLVLGLGIAFALMYVETWAIEQAPMWSSACILRPAAKARTSDVGNESLPRDTAGPVAVLH